MPRRIRRCIIGTAFALTALALLSTPIAAQAEKTHDGMDDLRIHVQPGTITERRGLVQLMVDQSLADQAPTYAAMAAEHLDSTARAWGLELDGVPVIIYMTSARINFSQSHCDPQTTVHAGGYAMLALWPLDASTNTLYPTAVIDGSQSPELIEMALRHEMVHVATYRTTQWHAATLPVWFQQGIAYLYQGEPGTTITAAEQYAGHRGRVPQLKEIVRDAAHNDAPTNEACAYAADFIGYCERTHGPRWVGRVLAGIRDGKDLEPAIAEVSGTSLDHLVTAWRKDLEHRVRRRAHEKAQFAGVLLGFIAFMVGITWLVNKATRGRAFGTIVDMTPDGRAYCPTGDRQPRYMANKIPGVESMLDADQTKRRETMRKHALDAIDGSINWPVFYSAWSGVPITDPLQRATYSDLLELHEDSPGYFLRPGVNYSHPDTKKMITRLRLDAALLSYDVDSAILDLVRIECLNVPEADIETEVARRVDDHTDRIHPHTSPPPA